jgi:hypothetical protein
LNFIQNIDVKAVALGTILTFLLDMVVGVAMLFLFGQGAFQPGMTEAEASAVLTEILQQPSYLFLGFVLGTSTTVVGGYVGARIAGRLPYLNAATIGLAGIVLGALIGNSDAPTWFVALAFAVNIPAALFGGHVAKRRLEAGS